MYKLDKQQKVIIAAVIGGALLTLFFLSLSSCNVTRTITTKTTESYDASKKFN